MTLKKYTVELLQTAEKEIKDACDWYEEQQDGLSLKFLADVNHSFNLIAQNPLHFSQFALKNNTVLLCLIYSLILLSLSWMNRKAQYTSIRYFTPAEILQKLTCVNLSLP
jgi:hypothetical protein